MEYPAGDRGPAANEWGRTKALRPHVKRRPEVKGPLQGGGTCAEVALRRSSCHGNSRTADRLVCSAPVELY